MPPSVFDKMYNHVLTDKGLEIFDADHKETQRMIGGWQLKKCNRPPTQEVFLCYINNRETKWSQLSFLFLAPNETYLSWTALYQLEHTIEQEAIFNLRSVSKKSMRKTILNLEKF